MFLLFFMGFIVQIDEREVNYFAKGKKYGLHEYNFYI